MLDIVRAAAFVASMGVNIHLPYTDGDYSNARAVIADLQYLGLQQVRDAAPDDRPYGGDEGQRSYLPVAQAGAKFTFIVGNKAELPRSIRLASDMAKTVPGSVSAIEGPNEVNNWPVEYNGLKGDAGAIAFQAALYDLVKADPRLKAAPVYNLTSWPDLVGRADASNFHTYPHKGEQPRQYIADGVAAQKKLIPKAPVVLTEVGYYTLPGGGTWGGVSPAAQGKLMLNLVFDAVDLGVERTFLYQLLDAYDDPENKEMEKHFGLFDSENRPKPIAHALHNLTSILKDDRPDATTFAVKPVDYTLKGMPATAHSLLLQKASGQWVLALWNEPDIWDETANKEVVAADHPVSVTFAKRYRDVAVFDPYAAATPLMSASNTDSVQITLTDRPILIRIGPEPAT